MSTQTKASAFGNVVERNDDALQKKWSQPRVAVDIAERKRPVLDFANDPGKTDPSFAKDCDVNVIADRFLKSGVLPMVDKKAMYGDFSQPMDYQTALNTVIHAQDQFLGLDAKTRARFGNDPALFLEFVQDPKNLQEMIKLGLAEVPPKTDADRIVDAIKASESMGTPPSPAPAPSGATT